MNQSHHYDQITFPSSEEVEVQLDILNKTSTQINELEKRLEISRDAYRKVLTDHSGKLHELSKKLGKCITRTRPYNELKQKQVYYRKKVQLAAVKYDNAISTLTTARETLAELEKHIFQPGLRDSSTLESLNQAITNFNDANRSLNNAKSEHEQLMEIYAANEQSLRHLEKRHRFDIHKAKPYYTMYNQFVVKIEEAKVHVELCADKLKACKAIYAEAMSKLEHFSNSVHILRQSQCTSNDDMNNRDNCYLSNTNNDEYTHYSLRSSNLVINSKDTDNKSTSHMSSSLNQTPTSFDGVFTDEVRQINEVNKVHQCSTHFSVCDLQMNSSKTRIFPIMDGLLESVHQATIELDAFEHSIFLSPVDVKAEYAYITPVPRTTITPPPSLSSYGENNSCSESLSVSSSSSSSISRALSFDAVTSSSADEPSTLFLIHSFSNLTVTPSTTS